MICSHAWVWAGARNRTGGRERFWKETTTIRGQQDPFGTSSLNIAKETTRRILCRIDGVTEFTQRMQGINVSGGDTNAAEYCQTLFGLPDYTDVLVHYRNSKVVSQ
jgi:hypothetical protein